MLGIFKHGLDKTILALKSEKPPVITKDALLDMLLEADVPYDIAEEIIYYLPPSAKVAKSDLNRVMKTYFLYDSPKPQATPFGSCEEHEESREREHRKYNWVMVGSWILG